MTGWERRRLERLTDTLLAPAPPLPPVPQTDTVAAFEFMLRRAPLLNRLALRLAVALQAKAEPVRAAVAMTYYGDPTVQRVLGYDP